MQKLLYKQDDFPVFQNFMYESKEDAIFCLNKVRFSQELDCRSNLPSKVF